MEWFTPTLILLLLGHLVPDTVYAANQTNFIGKRSHNLKIF